ETSEAQRIGQAGSRSTGRRSWRGWCIRGKEAWDRIDGRVTVVDRESEWGARRNQWERTSEQPYRRWQTLLADRSGCRAGRGCIPVRYGVAGYQCRLRGAYRSVDANDWGCEKQAFH